MLVAWFKISIDEHSCHACHIQQRGRSKRILCQPVHEMLHRNHGSVPLDLSMSRLFGRASTSRSALCRPVVSSLRFAFLRRHPRTCGRSES